MIKVGVVGGAGYAGMGVLQILCSHPEAEIVWVSSEQAHAGKKLSDLRPSLSGICDLVCQPPDITAIIDAVDVVIMALPNGLAMKLVPAILKKGKKAIDVSADFRIKDLDEYKKWYKIDHASPELVAEAVYGLPELFMEKIKGARLIANPGCYPTASILASAPLAGSGLVDPSSIVIDAKSGVSGAGAALTEITHFPECNENLRAYAVASHRHNPEIDQVLGEVSGKKITTTFVPHLIPMNRGIHSTVYATLSAKADTAKLHALYRDFYKGKYFVRVLDQGRFPATKYVSGSNFCDINVVADERSGRVIVMSVIDNLVKGAAGQAVQNMNIICGLDERTGLDGSPLYP